MRKNGPMAVKDFQGASAPKRRVKRSWGWLVALIVLGLLVGGGVGTWQVTNGLATSRYAERIETGDMVGTLVIPRLGLAYAVPIVEGTSEEDLRQGVGWYEGTAAPGQIGNCALAGHRLGWGQPFADLDTLEVGDEISLTTRDTTYIYKVITGPTVVAATLNDVLAAVPGDPGRQPSKALITLTTAATVLPSPNRLVVIAELTPPS